VAIFEGCEKVRAMNTSPSKPDWSYWENLADVPVSEAVALSCDFDPRSVRYLPEYAKLSRIPHEFYDRLTIARSHISAGKLHVEPRDSIGESHIKLADFRVWGEGLTRPFVFPNEFPRESPAAVPPRPLRSDARTNLLRVIRALYEKLNMPEREATSTLAQMIQSLGFDGPEDDTIRAVLKEARELTPDHTPK
jgi:hypothetical protein